MDDIRVSVLMMLWAARYAPTQGMQAQAAGAVAHFLNDTPLPGRGVYQGPERFSVELYRAVGVKHVQG